MRQFFYCLRYVRAFWRQITRRFEHEASLKDLLAMAQTVSRTDFWLERMSALNRHWERSTQWVTFGNNENVPMYNEVESPAERQEGTAEPWIATIRTMTNSTGGVDGQTGTIS